MKKNLQNGDGVTVIVKRVGVPDENEDGIVPTIRAEYNWDEVAEPVMQLCEIKYMII